MDPLTYNGMRMSQKKGDVEHGGIKTDDALVRKDPACLTICLLPRYRHRPQYQKSLLKACGKGRLPFVLKITLMTLGRPQPLGQVRGFLGLFAVTHVGHCQVSQFQCIAHEQLKTTLMS